MLKYAEGEIPDYSLCDDPDHEIRETIKLFDREHDHWCTAEFQVATRCTDCRRCIMCDNYEDENLSAERKRELFAEYVFARGYQVTRPGYACVPYSNFSEEVATL